jgi:hypothetical protein
MSYPHYPSACGEHHDLVRDFGPSGNRTRSERPRIVTLCGSTRFKDEINAVNARLTMQGHIVISMGVFGHADMPDREDLWTTGASPDKIMLDELHKRKIDLADSVFVVNVGGYVGESTRSEIDYAVAQGKPVEWLVPFSTDVPPAVRIAKPSGAAQAGLEAMLREFHVARQVHHGILPAEPTADVPERTRDVRIALLAEEVEELRDAMMAGDLVGIADGVTDVIYVAAGTGVRYGLPVDALIAEVHRSNMTKSNPAPDSLKLAKGDGYEPPRIAEILAAATRGDQWVKASDGRYWPAGYLPKADGNG